jgi:hypothetical protein
MKTYQDGLKDAHDFLLRTAADYREMAERAEHDAARFKFPGHISTAKNEARTLKEKAELLTGQANHILSLK